MVWISRQNYRYAWSGQYFWPCFQWYRLYGNPLQLEQQLIYKMSSNVIRQPDKYELASVVTKNSRTGITSNRRLLVIKGGKLYYYSSVPKNFTGDTKVLELSHQLPKCSIDIMNIKRVNGFDVSSPYFSIDFNAGHMMEKQDIRNSSMNQNYNFSPKDTKQQITWQFTCDNQFIKQRWVTSLNHLIEYYKQQNLEIQKFMQNIQNNSLHPEEFKNSSNGSFSSRSSIRMPIPWRESAISRRSYNPDKGFEFKDSSSPPATLQKIEDLSFLKKNPSDNSILDKNIDDHQFEMIIQEQPTKSLFKSRSEDHKIDRTEDNLKKSILQTTHMPLSMIEKPSVTKSNPLPLSFSTPSSSFNPAPLSPIPVPIINSPLNQSNLPITIQQLPEQSIPQTPIKQHSISFHEQQTHSQGRRSVQKTLADLKMFNQIQQPKRQLTFHSYSMFKHQVPAKPQQKVVHRQAVASRQQPVFNKEQLVVNKQNSIHKQDVVTKQYKQIALNKTDSIDLIYESPAAFLQPSIYINEIKSTQIQKQMAYNEQFYPFHYLWGEGLKIQTKFSDRIDCQKQMLHQMLNFKQRAIQSLADYLESKALGQNRYPIIEENSRFIVLQIGNILLKIASMTTQKININGSHKIFYNEDNIKNLKRQFKVHQNLFKSISKRLRSEPSLKIRIPLSVFIQFRGVVCIATRQYTNQQQLHSVEEDEWTNQKNLLLEEGYKLESFTYKKVGRYLQVCLKAKGKNVDKKDEQNFKEYLKKTVLIGRKEKHHNLMIDPPIDRTFLEIAHKQNASTSIQSLQRYVKGLKLAKNLQGPCPKVEIIEALQNCIFCKKLRKIYRSAQGQINETHFFNLIFKKQPSIINLLNQSDCQVPQKIRGQLFSFIQHYFGIILEIDQKVYQDYIQGQGKERKNSKDIFISSTARPIVREYPLQGFQIIESWSKLTYYLQNKHPLGKSALQTKREIFRMSQNLALDQHHQLLYDQAYFYYYQADYTSCIRKCKQYEKSCPYKSTKLLLIYLLMMKSYSQFSETDFSIIFKKANDLIEFNYGPQNSSFVNLYSLAAFYYEKLSQKPNIKREIGLSQLSIKLIKQAQQLCSARFGINSKQYLDILLDASRLYQSTDINVSILYFEEVKKLCQSNPYLCIPQTLITVLSYEIELNIKRSLIAQAEAVLTNALTFIDSKLSLKSKIHLYKLQYEVGFYGQKPNHCQAAVEKLWQLGTYEKLQALELAYKAAFKQSGVSESQNLIDQQDSVRFESQQRALVTVEQQKYKNKSLIDTLLNAIENKDTHFLTLVYFLIRKY